MRVAGFPFVLLLAASAAGQERDPFEAAAEAARVRERQAQGMHRAEDRTYDPFRADPRGPGDAPTGAPPGGLPAAPTPPAASPAPPPRARRDGSWSVAGVAVVAALVAAAAASVVLVRRAGRAPDRR